MLFISILNIARAISGFQEGNITLRDIDFYEQLLEPNLGIDCSV